MDSLIWAVIIALSVESFGVFGQEAQSEVQLPNFDSKHIEAFKKFLQKSLSPDEIYNRHLLISTGILPTPLNYATPRETDAEMSNEQILFEYEHFKHFTEEILASEEKIIDAIYKLFSAGLLKDMIDSETNSLLFSDLTTTLSNDLIHSDWLSNYSSDVDIVNLNPDQQMAFKNTQYEVVSETLSESQTSETASTSPEPASFTTEYINFLTDEHPEFSSSEPDDKSDQKCTAGAVFLENDLSSSVSPITEGYIQFFKTSTVPITSEIADETEVPASTEVYSTDSLFSSAAFDADGTKPIQESAAPLISDYSPINDDEESISSSSEDTYVNQDLSTDYDTLKLWSAGEEPIEKTSLPTEDLTYTSQSNMFEHVTENQKMLFQTDEPETNFESSSTESEEESSPSLRVAKEIRHNDSESGSSSRIDLIRGTPGIQYPNYEDIPDNEFNCKDKMHIPGFYADIVTRCQVFHVCWPGRRESFLCPIGTTFNQAILACDYWYNSNCSVSSAYFDVNTAFKEVDATKTGMTGPMIDTLIKDTKKTPSVPDEVISSSGEISELYEADVHFSETVAKHELSKIWRFLPVKVKVFIQPQLKLEDIISKTQLKRSKKGITEERDDTDIRPDISKVQKQSKQNFESMILEVLKNLVHS